MCRCYKMYPSTYDCFNALKYLLHMLTNKLNNIAFFPVYCLKLFLHYN